MSLEALQPSNSESYRSGLKPSLAVSIPNIQRGQPPLTSSLAASRGLSGLRRTEDQVRIPQNVFKVCRIRNVLLIETVSKDANVSHHFVSSIRGD